MKPLIHFAHANGVPSKVYQKFFDALSDQFDVIYTTNLGVDQRYPVDQHWESMTQQVIDNIVQKSHGRKVIGIGHSLGGVLTFKAALKCPELFSQTILLDPPLIMGLESFAMHIAKSLKLKAVDQMSPAALSKRRRDHWDSREQAATLLRPKALYAAFDEQCFNDYIQFALVEDPTRGGVELAIPKSIEVDIFRTNPSLWWLPQPKLKVPSQLIVASQGPFLARKFPHKVRKKFGVPFSIFEGGHMFPLEHPDQLAAHLKTILTPQKNAA
ncbi:alpha/beta fold hydrolase [Acinetobacter sp. YH16032]|uniref:alpha/beta fold hydrolase n=1 Tax=Acinetobacter sp. YH16032 TaxID=2601181 RepID=UPI0015D214CF|nr:alpha/beta hydrolase [Acinetobacter sp. YH16032]